MSKYKINIDKAPPSDEAIERYKKRNFDGMLGEYKKLHDIQRLSKPLYKDKKFFRLVMLIFVVLLAMFFAHDANDDKKTPGDEKKSPTTTDSTINKTIDSTETKTIE